MKRFLVLASVAAVMLSSCNKTQELPGGGGSDQKTVRFDTYLGNQTKGVSKNAFKMGDQFHTFGVKTVADFDVTAPAFTEYVFLGTGGDHGAVVSHYGLDDAGKAIWNFDEVAPWDEKKATFFAFSPVPQGLETYGITIKPISDNAIPAIDYKVVGGYDPAIIDLNDPVVAAARSMIKKQPDLLYSFSPNNTEGGGVIQMPFQHSLSQVRFSVRAGHSAGSFLRLNSVTLTSVNTKGELKLATDESKKGEVTYVGGWGIATEPENFDINLKTEVVYAIPGGVTTVWSVTDDDESLLMIPQKLTGAGLKIRYSYSVDGIEWQEYEAGTSMDYVLSDLTPTWQPNKSYNYIINITPGKAIVFKPVVDAWEPVGTADLEYRKFVLPSAAGPLSIKSDGTNEKFTLNKGDKISASYVNGAAWIEVTDAAVGSTKVDLTATAIEVTDATKGDWDLSLKSNILVGATLRKATIIIERAPYEKTLSNGSKIMVKAGVAKYEISQSATVPPVPVP